MTKGCDYSSARPDPVCLHRLGIRFAVRYTSIGPNPKNMSAAEVRGLLAAGIALATVFEEEAGHMLRGRAAGVAAAKASRDLAGACGMPAGRPHYFALDIDPRPLRGPQWEQAKAYLDGAASVLGRSAVGVYGGFLAIENLVPRWAPWGWQTVAWSDGKWSAKAHLQQYEIEVTHCGGAIDLNRTHPDRSIADYGQWGLGQPGALSTADIDDILNKLELLRVGEKKGQFDPHDFASLEGVSMRLNHARADIDWLKTSVKAIAAATGATLPPEG
jgi:Rv2525c-like, glycoside hydrolase-like domain